MGFEKVTIFGTLELLYSATGIADVQFLTDLPGNALAVRAFDDMPAAAGRRPFRLRMHGTVKGTLYQVAVIPRTGVTAEVYGARVWARQLGPVESAWQWYTVPIVETPLEYVAVPLPVEESPLHFSAVKLPIDPTSDLWQPAKLPVEATPDVFSAVPLPVEQPPETWTGERLPVRVTPPRPDWIEIPVDE